MQRAPDGNIFLSAYADYWESEIDYRDVVYENASRNTGDIYL